MPRSPPRREGSFGPARDGQDDLGALALLGFELDGAAVGFDELARQRQSQSERRLAPDALLHDPVEAVEYARQVFGGDSRTVVADADHGLVIVPIRLEDDPAFPVGVS